jgi:hypothetical protein
MASIGAFNNVLLSFLNELTNLYGESEPRIQTYAKSFPILAEATPSMPLEMFMSNYGKYTEKISAKDETLFEDVPYLFNDINVGELWKNTAEENKEAMWKYLQTLVLLGTTIKAIPSSMLSSIETVAMDCAKHIENGQLDPTSLMSAIPKILGGIKF